MQFLYEFLRGAAVGFWLTVDAIGLTIYLMRPKGK